MNKKANIETKKIALDELSREFLNSLKERREKAGLTQSVVAEYTGVHTSVISRYEHGQKTPLLKYFLKLAEILKYDLSDSINYKIFYGRVGPADIKRQLKFYGLTYPELEKLTGYSVKQLTSTVNFSVEASVKCLSAIIQVLAREQKTYDYIYGAGRKKRLRI